MGTTLFAEYEAVMARDALFRKCILTPRERDELLDAFLSVCQWTHIYFAWRPNVPDESDNHLVELAVAGGAEAMVTRNVRDLAFMELRFPGIRVVSPAVLAKE
jgi:predicted nucleic acid-binding protein